MVTAHGQAGGVGGRQPTYDVKSKILRFFAIFVCVVVTAHGQAVGVGGRQPPYESK